MRKTIETSDHKIPGRGHISISSDHYITNITMSGPFLRGHNLNKEKLVQFVNDVDNKSASTRRKAIIFQFKVSLVVDQERLDHLREAMSDLSALEIIQPSIAIVINPELDGYRETSTLIAGLVSHAKYDVSIFSNIFEATSWSRRQSSILPIRHFEPLG